MTKILCIDDEPYMRLTTCDFLADMGYEVIEAASGSEGIQLFREQRPEVVLTDLRMSCGDGFQVIEHLSREHPETPIIIISGTGSIVDAVRCMRLGAWDYIPKPMEDLSVLHRTIQEMLARMQEKIDARSQSEKLERQLRTLELELLDWDRKYRATVLRLEQTLHHSIRSLTMAVDEKDPYTAGHNKNVAAIAVEIGRALGLGQPTLDTLLISGLLHDIGKIGVPEALLNKRERLTEEEYEQIKTHVVKGYRILGQIPFEGPVAEIVRQHHERYDGGGYPRGLSGEEILLEARILSVADVFEALTSDRPYRTRISGAEAFEHLLSQRGGQFCPLCVDAFERVLKRSS